MTKRMFFIVISVVFMFLSCGNNDSCTTTHSYGTNSFTKDVSNTCLKKLSGTVCYRNSSKEDIAKTIAKLQEYEFVFLKDECRDLNEKDKYGNYKIVECPNFIPESFNFTKLAGCEIYTVDPHTDCDIIGCPKIFFETNNGYFIKIAYEKSEESESMILHSRSTDGKVEFYSGNQSSFSWSEKAEDGTEIKKSVAVSMKIVDSSIIDEDQLPDEDEDINIPDDDVFDSETSDDENSAQCKDNEGRTYNEGDKIPDDCHVATCMDGGWATDSSECYPCNAELGEIMYWMCADGVSKVEWCECAEVDGESYVSEWICLGRPDLTCPK